MTNTYQADYYRQHAERLNAYSRAYNDKLREMTAPHATRTGERRQLAIWIDYGAARVWRTMAESA